MGYFDDVPEAPPGALENALLKRRKMMEEASKRNIAAMRPGSMPPEMIRAQALLARLNGGGGAAPQAVPAPEPANPMDSLRLKGGNVGYPLPATMPNERAARGVSEVFAKRGSEDVDAAKNALQAQLADPAYIAARNRQGERARAVAGGTGFHRKTHNEIVQARRDAHLAMLQKYNMAAIQPQLAMIAAQKGLDPLQQAHANMFNAQAGYYNQMSGAPAGGNGAAPAPEAPAGLPPGAPGWQGIGRESEIASSGIRDAANTFINGAEHTRRRKILESQIGPRTAANAAQYDAMLRNMMRD